MRPIELPVKRGTDGQAKKLTAWVITGPMTAIEMSGCTLITVFAYGTIGIAGS